MNKQEAIKEIEKLEGLTIKDKDFNFDIEMIPKGEALEIVNRLDEPEKLYTVGIPNPRATLHFVLRKYAEGEVCISCYNSDDWRDYKCVQLTESEIKQDFDWAWKYAKEVEDD